MSEAKSTSSVIYKYVSRSTANAILANKTLRFGRPTEMNDPFDVYISDLFDAARQDSLLVSCEAALDLILNRPIEFAKAIGEAPEIVATYSNLIKHGSNEQRDLLMALVKQTVESDLQSRGMFVNLEKQRAAVTSQFRNAGIFCATLRNDNLLMWAHYADQHRGVVLGFQPDATMDSFLCRLEPVIYADERPQLFGDPLNPPQIDDIHEFSRKLTSTKSIDWAYEEELRIYIPSAIPTGQEAVYFQFHSHELTEMYLGLRFDQQSRQRVIENARLVNPDIAIFQASLASGTYTLNFDPIKN